MSRQTTIYQTFKSYLTFLSYILRQNSIAPLLETIF